MRFEAKAACLAILGVATAAIAAAVPGGTREALQPLLSCRAETDAAARLACYDKAADALKAATERRDIVVVDKAEVQKARRSLFGFAIPSLKLFGADDRAGDQRRSGDRRGPTGIDAEVDEVATSVRSARQDRDGLWIITMEDGAVWHQTGGTLAVTPKAGSAVTIRRAALGSYFLRVGRAPGVKARREG